MVNRADGAIPIKGQEFTKAKTKSDGVDKGFLGAMKKAGLEDTKTDGIKKIKNPTNNNPQQGVGPYRAWAEEQANRLGITPVIDASTSTEDAADAIKKQIGQNLSGMNQ